MNGKIQNDWRFESHYGGRRRVRSQKCQASLIIENKELDDSRYIKEFHLLPLTSYIATVHAVGNNIEVQEGEGHSHIGANICLFGTWTHSNEFNDGIGEFDGNLTVKFRTDKTGKVQIGLRLGFWCSEAKGSVTFSDFTLEEDYSKIVLGAGQIRLDVSNEVLQDNPEILNHAELFLSRIEKVYNSMGVLYSKFPFDHDVIFYETKDNIHAWAYAGNPIVWNTRCFVDYFNKLDSKKEFSDDACFGAIHEMGHNFDMSGFGHINPELFANLNLCYAVEVNNLPIYFDHEETIGKGLQDGFYRRCYERSIAKGKYHHDGLLFVLLRIKDIIGWDSFRKVFRKYSNAPINHDKYKKSELLQIFFKELSDASGLDIQDMMLPGEFDLLVKQENY